MFHQHRIVLGAAFLCLGTLMLAGCGGETTTSTPEALEITGNTPRERFDSFVEQTLVVRNGLSETDARCVVEELKRTVPDKSAAQVMTTSQLTPGVVDAAERAEVDCTTETAGN